MLHQCPILTAQRLSGPVDSDKVTELGSDLTHGVNRQTFGCTLYILSQLWQKKERKKRGWDGVGVVNHQGQSGLSDICCQTGTQKALFWMGGVFASQLTCRTSTEVQLLLLRCIKMPTHGVCH